MRKSVEELDLNDDYVVIGGQENMFSCMWHTQTARNDGFEELRWRLVLRLNGILH